MQPEDLYDATSLAHDFGSVSRETLSRLELYGELLVKWNKSINLVSRDSLRDLWRRHFLDSAQLLEYIPTSSTGSAPVLVDLGSGAGFPGLVLAILGAGDVHLIESDQRKAVFLREVARETECQVTVHNKRIEQVETFAADVVTARAFAPMGDLLEYAWPFLSFRTEKSAPTNDTDTPRNGCLLLLKGKNVDQELTDAGKRWSMHVERFSSRSSIEGQILRLDALPIGD
jgi:16S rRNA (guanine527-N7)-methyltransferase